MSQVLSLLDSMDESMFESSPYFIIASIGETKLSFKELRFGPDCNLAENRRCVFAKLWDGELLL